MSIRSELLALQQQSDGNVLHVERVVVWARDNPESALHRNIEWDNEKAADSYRLWQVRKLVQIHIISQDGTPQMVSLSVDRKAGGGYRSMTDVVGAPDLKAIMLQDALKELERIQIKYSRLEALTSVWAEADAVREKSGVKRRHAGAEIHAEYGVILKFAMSRNLKFESWDDLPEINRKRESLKFPPFKRKDALLTKGAVAA